LLVTDRAAFLAAVVRAPLTGIILITGMTASFTLILAKLSGCAMAMVVPALPGNVPIYNSLRERILHGGGRKLDASPPGGQ